MRRALLRSAVPATPNHASAGSVLVSLPCGRGVSILCHWHSDYRHGHHVDLCARQRIQTSTPQLVLNLRPDA